jgi:hypothetical protein
MEPVVEAEVLTALDFDTPPVEVVAEPPVKFVFDAAKFSIPENYTVTWSAGGPVVDEPTAPSVNDIMAAMQAQMFQQMVPCGCPMCSPGVTKPMDPVAKHAWVQALRSGEYPQGRGALHQGTKWCALGVLVDVAIKAGVRVTEQVHPDHGSTGYDGEYGSLPKAVQEWAGLNVPDPRVSRGPVAWLNDTGTPFSRIANYIEAEL